MASIPCPECQAEVPVRSKICPKCGTLVRPIGRGGKMISFALAAVFVAVAVVALVKGPAP